nr:hypothetical protein [Lachnospiraceae bacterium]
GHLFQDRYKSEPVEDERYFLTVLRYIIQNPMRAGMEDAPGKYPWTSFGAYLGHYDAFTETDLAISIGGGKESLVEFLMEKNEDSAMEVKNSQRFLSDHESKKVMLSLTGCQTVSEFQNLPSDIQKEYFVQLYNSGISMAQIGRMTGRSKTLVHRAIRG